MANRAYNRDYHKGFDDGIARTMDATDSTFHAQLIEALKKEHIWFGEWLMKHCKGFHAGNHGGQLGHFGIYRSEVDKLLKGERPNGE